MKGESSASGYIVLIIILLVAVFGIYLYIKAPVNITDPEIKEARQAALQACEHPIQMKMMGMDPKDICPMIVTLCDKMPGVDKISCYKGAEGFEEKR